MTRIDVSDLRSQVKGEPVAHWLTASEAARYLRVKSRTLLLWARQGKVKGYMISGTKRHVWRFRQADLDAAVLASSCYPSGRRLCS